MAKKPKAPAIEAHPLDEQANERLDDCRRQKTPFELDIREGYFFSAPLRSRQINSQGLPPSTPMHDDGLLNTSVGFDVTEDLATEVMNTFMPEAENWCERAKGMFVSQAAWDQVADQVKADDDMVFDAMKASNVYPELAKSFVPDLSIGTVGIMIDRPHASAPITALGIPIRELEINLGPFGELDDRFAIRHTKNRHVRALLAGVTLPPDIAEKVDGQPNEHTEVRWGYWRKWEERGDETWQHVTMVGDRVVNDAVLKGEGCCPLIVMRFGATTDWAWALGSLLKSLPELRQTDELEAQKIAHIELNLTPPIGFPDDTIASIEQGLESGCAYPVRPGSGDALKRIYEPGSPEVGIYAVDAKVKGLRKRFFVDYPEQTGDTPPTLGQWLDELARAQRRIGTPGLTFFQEGPAKIFQRFVYLLTASGVIQPVRTKEGLLVSTRPRNPAQRAAEQQEIAMATRAISICGQAFPEEFKAYIDGKESMKAILDKMRVKLLKFRNEDQVNNAVAMIGKLLKQKFEPTGNPEQAQGLP